MHTARSCARWIPRRRFRLYSYLSTPFMCPPLDQPGAIVWDGQLEIFWAATVRRIESPVTRRADYLISHPVILGLTTTVPTVTAASAKTRSQSHGNAVSRRRREALAAHVERPSRARRH